MKKILVVAAIVLAVLLVGFFGAYKFINSEAVSGSKQEKVEAEAVDYSTSPVGGESEQTDKIGGVQYDIGIDNTSSEYKVIEVMHKMTHQKVKADEKWGAIPMVPDTISRV